MSAPWKSPSPLLNYQPPKRHPQQPSAGDIKDAVKALLAARKPMIWSGMGVLLGNATDELREFAELTEIPVYCTMPGKSGFNERHPLSLGSGSGATTLQARTWLNESDVLFAVGSSLSITGYGQSIPGGKIMIHNTESIEDLNKDFTVDVGVPGDAKLTLQALIEEVKVAARREWASGQERRRRRDCIRPQRLDGRLDRPAQLRRDSDQHIPRHRRA